MYVEVANNVLKFNDIFDVRKMRSHIHLDEREQAFIQHQIPIARQERPDR